MTTESKTANAAWVAQLAADGCGVLTALKSTHMETDEIAYRPLERWISQPAVIGNGNGNGELSISVGSTSSTNGNFVQPVQRMTLNAILYSAKKAAMHLAAGEGLDMYCVLDSNKFVRLLISQPHFPASDGTVELHAFSPRKVDDDEFALYNQHHSKILHLCKSNSSTSSTFPRSDSHKEKDDSKFLCVKLLPEKCATATTAATTSAASARNCGNAGSEKFDVIGAALDFYNASFPTSLPWQREATYQSVDWWSSPAK